MNNFANRNLKNFENTHLIKIDGSYAGDIHDYIERESSIAKDMFK